MAENGNENNISFDFDFFEDLAKKMGEVGKREAKETYRKAVIELAESLRTVQDVFQSYGFSEEQAFEIALTLMEKEVI